MFLIHYAEANQELALLSINTFQKDLASSSQRVRANAMKAMSSIRISVVIPLVTLALKAAVKDNSPYVRKTAACAIPKIYSVDPSPEQKEILVELIGTVLGDNEPGVLGAAIFAFFHVCPKNYELIHGHFRKFCTLLADFDEWGQVLTLDLLLKYGRTQFGSPFLQEDGENDVIAVERDPNRPFYSDDEDDEDGEKDKEKEKEKEKKKEEKPVEEASLNVDDFLMEDD